MSDAWVEMRERSLALPGASLWYEAAGLSGSRDQPELPIRTRLDAHLMMSAAGFEPVRLILARLVSAYFLSYNTIYSTSRALFILPAEQSLCPT